MRIAFFYHSLVSDWNHGNAHFLRGVAGELQARGHRVFIYEPRKGWSLQNLVAEYGQAPITDFEQAYPDLRSRFYDPESIDLDKMLADMDLVVVHEWNDHSLVRRIGAHHRRNPHYRLLFHDTHHRSLTDSQGIQAYQLDDYDGVLGLWASRARSLSAPALDQARLDLARSGGHARYFVRCRRLSEAATWSGSATGVMKNVRRSCRNSSSTPSSGSVLKPKCMACAIPSTLSRR